MTRLAYRCLIALHPRAFRERFGEEMLCVFDEAAVAHEALFFTDGFVSLARQWLLRSGVWKLALGAAFTSLLILSVSHSEVNWQNKLAARAAAQDEKLVRPLDKARFNREAAQAVAMLAGYREADKKRVRRTRSSSGTQSGPVPGLAPGLANGAPRDATSQD